MKPRKLKSGNWNVSVYVGMDADGQKHYRSVTAPTRKECLAKALDLSSSTRDRRKVVRVEEVVRKYIQTKEAVLSPNTTRMYKSMYDNYFNNDRIGFFPADRIDDRYVQRWIGELSKIESPKTVRNIYGLFSAAMRYENPRYIFAVNLPQRRMPKLHTPTTDEVDKIISMSKEREDKTLYYAILLGAVGMMRLGEVCALTADDIDRKKNTITINKSLAVAPDGSLVVKPPKNDSSNRTIEMPQFVIDELPKSGRIVPISPNAVSMLFRKLIKKSGVVPFRFHDLRHYAASIAASSSIGVSVETIKARGGWATDGMMKRVYINQIGDEVDKDTQNINIFYEKKWGKKG